MVNLVKIRKKAKEKKEKAAAEAASRPAPKREAAPAGKAAPERSPSRGGRAGPKKGRAKKGPAGSGKPDARPAPAAGPEQQAPAKPAPKVEKPPEARERRGRGGGDRLDEFKESAGTRRDDSSRAVEAPQEPSTPQIELLSFTLAGEQYAIDIERIAEIIAPRPTTPVPNAPSPVVGIISLRGTIVTMLDLRRQLGHASGFTVGPETRTIVVEDGAGMAGFVVDRVLRVIKIDPTRIQSHPIVSPAEQTEAIRGVIQQGGGLTIVLDVERLLA